LTIVQPVELLELVDVVDLDLASADNPTQIAG